MANAKKCDKCRKYIDEHDHRVEVTLDYKWQGQIEPRSIDLCLRCQGLFDNFLSEKVEEQE